MNSKNDSKVHDPDTPFFFRHFVDALFRLFYLKTKQRLVQAIKELEGAVANHFIPMMAQTKQPKPIIHDETLVEEKVKEMHEQLNGLQNILAEVRTKTRSKNEFLRLQDMICFLEVGLLDKHCGYSIKDHWHTLISIVESRLDPEESIKKIDQRIKLLQESSAKPKGKLERYEQHKANLINFKKGIELFDHEWAEVVIILLARIADIHGKDKKFDQKVKKLVDDFLEAIKERESKQKSKARRLFPESQKDYE